ncbi:hypothetical protein [Microbulbifer sp. TYP-18]|uniref:hypothetical protein n=1 Tax=Microbulbifer sp. TYP-18 TaxID=3230024 RepID=UPI0034C65B03
MLIGYCSESTEKSTEEGVREESSEGSGQCPSEPEGALKKPTDKWLKVKVVDPHELKDGIGDSRLETYIDKMAIFGLFQKMEEEFHLNGKVISTNLRAKR